MLRLILAGVVASSSWNAASGIAVSEELSRKDTPRAQWSFDGNPAPGIHGITGLSSGTPEVGPVGYSPEVPGAFVYDPMTQTSRANLRSAEFRKEAEQSRSIATPVDPKAWNQPTSGITLEAFVRPWKETRGDAWLLGKSSVSAAGSELALEWHHLGQFGQTWHGARVRAPHQPPLRFPVGHYSSTTRLTPEELRWRHLAVVYDAQNLTVTCWVDYHLNATKTLETPLVFDDGPIFIGGQSESNGVAGLIDEPRVTLAVLDPSQFLRARRDSISGVSFTSGNVIVPDDAGCYNVKAHFGAAGDGATDDTDAFNTAFEHLANKVPLAYNTLIIPPGEYVVSGTLYCSRFIDVKGAGPDQTTIRLRDGTFTNPDDPQPVLRMSSTRGSPGSHPWVNGSSISIYLEGLTIDVGRDNPGAKGLEYHANNLGRLEHVVIRSPDGLGTLGLDLTHHDVGPALVKRVTVDGFDVGVAIRYQEYSHTIEHLTLRNQNVCGFRNQGNIVAIRKLHSVNRMPAVISQGANAMVTLIDSRLEGGDTSQSAIESEGAIYALRVETRGYGRALAQRVFDREARVSAVSLIEGPNLEEFVGDRVHLGFGRPSGALKLPIAETPEPSVPPVEEWVNVIRFAGHKQGRDWSPAVMAAIASGARVLYFPSHERFEFHSPIRMRAPLERIIGLGKKLQWAPDVWKEAGRVEQTDLSAAPPPLLIYDEPNPDHVLVLDRLECRHIQHASPATLVLRSSSPDRYTTGSGGGRLFAEDVGGADWHFEHPQRVWVRQWNPESHAAGPCIHSRGTRIWALGFKTEYESQKLLAEDGSETEILGGFIYPIGKIPPDRPIFENRDSAISLVYGVSVYQSNHKIHIRDRKAEVVKETEARELTWPSSRGRMDLYTSDSRP